MLKNIWQRWFKNGPQARSAFRYSRMQCLAIERLEPRLVLSGNVQAFVADNDLMILGDDQANTVQIALINNDVVLRGNEGTTINGGATFTIRTGSNQIQQNIIATFGRHDDQFLLDDGIRYLGGVTISTGKGNDRVGVDNSTMADNLVLIMGKGNDSIAIRNSTIGGKLIANTDKGSDTVSVFGTTVGTELIVDTGKQNDVVEVENSTINGFASIKTSAGNDTAILKGSTFRNAIHMFLGRGSDVVDFGTTTVSGEARFNLDRGSDIVRFASGTDLPATLIVTGGSGGDSVNATSATSAGVNRQITGVETNTIDANLIDGRLSGANARLAAAQSILGANGQQPLTLTAGIDAAEAITSSGTLLTKQSTVTINGTSLLGATIELSRDADGLFNDGTTVVGAGGNYSVDATLLNNDTNRGANTVKVRATDSLGNQTIESLDIHLALGTVVRFASPLGLMDFELLDSDTPDTVDNFLNYQARYVSSIVHRSVKTSLGGDFVIQGGGFTVNGSNVQNVSTDPPVQSEADPANSNIRGTLAMALAGGNPDSGTSEWFVNLANNSSLDAQDFTVFGRVIGDGLDVADAIHDLTSFDLATLVGESAMTDVPLRNYVAFSTSLAGTVSTTTGSNSAIGIGTTFTTSVPADMKIRIGTQTFTVQTVVSDTELTLSTNATAGVSNVVANVNALPSSANYVTYTSIAELAVP